jgi:hypothetical protein
MIVVCLPAKNIFCSSGTVFSEGQASRNQALGIFGGAATCDKKQKATAWHLKQLPEAEDALEGNLQLKVLTGARDVGFRGFSKVVKVQKFQKFLYICCSRNDRTSSNV